MKTKFLIIMLVCVAMGAAGQKHKPNYRISADIKGLKDSWVYKISDNPSHQDSTSSKSGKFTFTGYVDVPKEVLLISKVGHSALSIFIDKNADIKITGNAKQFGNARAIGGKTQSENNELLAKNTQNQMQLDALNKAFKESGKTEPDNILEKKFDSLYKQMDTVKMEFIKQNPSSFVSLYKLNELVFRINPTNLGELFDKLDEPLKKSAAGKEMANLIAIKKRTDVGQMALTFSAPDTLGNNISLSSFRGKYVLLDFWASWCGPCRAENPNVLKAYNRFKEKGFTVLAVSIDKNKKAWNKAINEDKLPWTHVIDLKTENSIADMYGITAIPANFLLDPNGKILAVNLRGDSLVQQLEKILEK